MVPTSLRKICDLIAIGTMLSAVVIVTAVVTLLSAVQTAVCRADRALGAWAVAVVALVGLVPSILLAVRGALRAWAATDVPTALGGAILLATTAIPAVMAPIAWHRWRPWLALLVADNQPQRLDAAYLDAHGAPVPHVPLSMVTFPVSEPGSVAWA